MRAFFAYKFFFILSFILCCLLFSCSFSSTGESIDEQLAQVDSLIAVGDYEAAWASLKKAAKTIINASDTLGIVRRALVLQKDDFAKEQIFAALKETPENQELLAVYTHMLIIEKNYNEALLYGKKLEGGKYGSLYSELRFKVDEEELKEANSKKKEGEALDKIDYFSEEYVQAYVDIYTSTGDASYLRNASLVYALQGNMTKAYSFHPESISSYENPWFWAQIAYDAHMFEQVISDLQVFELSSDEMALLADAYVHLGLLNDAQRTWLESTQSFSLENPIAWHNIALYYQVLGDIKGANDVILYLVNTFPEYVGGLAAYGHFSLAETRLSTETIFAPLLRSKGLETLQMEEDSEIAVLDVQDVLEKMDKAIASLLHADESRAMELIVERQKLLWEVNASKQTTRQKVSDVWYMLETNVQDPYGYNPALVKFAMWYFFTQNMIDEADALFTTHCTTRYGTYYESINMYTKTPIENMEQWEYEYGSFLALKQDRFNDAEKWLTALIPNNSFSPSTSIAAAVNLATLYNATSKRYLALSLYEQLLPYIADANLKADIYYRMALIQYEMGESSRASVSLNEALLLDSNHSDARHLLKKQNE